MLPPLVQDGYALDCYIWDRQHDFKPTFEHPRVCYKKFSVSAPYYQSITLIKLFLFQCWAFFKLLFAGYDCIHAIDLPTGVVGFCVARIRKKPFVYHCLDPYYTLLPDRWPVSLSRVAQKTENNIISQADLFIITDLLRMPQHTGAVPGKTIEFANSSSAGLPYSGSLQKKDFTIGYIGGLVKARNLETLVDAAGELAGAGVKLIIGGFGPLENRIRTVCEKYKNIFFKSWIPHKEKEAIQQKFDVLVYVTDKNDKAQRWVSPNKLFESMALGKPIIVGEGTLTAQRVKMFGNGIAIPYGSKEELKRAILQLMNDPALRARMGEKGRREFLKNWTSEIMGERLIQAYREIFNKT